MALNKQIYLLKCLFFLKTIVLWKNQGLRNILLNANSSPHTYQRKARTHISLNTSVEIEASVLVIWVLLAMKMNLTKKRIKPAIQETLKFTPKPSLNDIVWTLAAKDGLSIRMNESDVMKLILPFHDEEKSNNKDLSFTRSSIALFQSCCDAWISLTNRKFYTTWSLFIFPGNVVLLKREILSKNAYLYLIYVLSVSNTICYRCCYKGWTKCND